MRRFLVILGKNYVLFYRRWIPTLVIILLPLLLAFTLVYLRSKYTRSEISHPTYWDAFRLNIPSAELFPFAPRTLLYAPNVSFFNEVMRVMRSEVAILTTGFPDASSLLNYLNVNSRRPKSIIGAVIFDRLSPTNGVTYSLRLPNAVDWSTRSLYPKFALGTPRTLDKCASPPAYCHSSFLAIQSALDRALTNVLCGENLSMVNFDFSLKRMPYPPYLDDPFILIIQRHLSFVIVLGYLFPVLHAIRCVLLEKQQRMKETLKMLGMSSAVHWFTWIMAYLTLFALMSAALTGVLCISFFGGGPVLPLSNPFLIFLLLMLYALSLLSFGMVLTTLFDSPHTGTAISCAILIIIFLPFLLLDQHYSELNLALKLIPSFLPSVAMGFVCMLIGHFEGAGLGVQFFNLFIPANPGDNLSVHVLCIVLLAQAAVCFAFTFYLDAVYPGTYGVPKPWYFPFTCLCRRRPTVSLLLEVNPDTGTNPDIAAPHSSSPQGAQNLFFEPGVVPTSVNNNPSSGFSSFPSSSSQLFSDVDYDPSEVRRYFASEPLDLPVGIALRKLRKVYKVKQTTNVAVAGLTMNLFQGQITVLLGHNGAGKTTTLSILTGLYLPTSGTAFVNGHDIRTDIEGVRKSLGFCPQQDVYFEDLTVREHLIMVARLRGFHGKELVDQVECILQKTHLLSKQHSYAGTLSGGMLRRLSIGMALLGDSRVVILDEPTSGLDPEARRQIWDILQSERSSRTILITTHYMDEADHLGDRIAILSAGTLRCIGSPLFLKAKYGAGYVLTIIKRSDVPPDNIIACVQRHVLDAVLRNAQGEELQLALPVESVGQFADLFTELESNKSELGILGFGVSMTTMEEVFFRVSGHDTYTDLHTVPTHCVFGSVGQDLNISRETFSDLYRARDVAFSNTEESLTALSSSTFNELHNPPNRGLSLYFQQLMALLTKRAIYMWRHRILTLSQLLIPFTLSLFALFVFQHVVATVQSDDPALLLSLKPYGTPLVVTDAMEDSSRTPRNSSMGAQFLWAYESQFDPRFVRSKRLPEAKTYEDVLINEVAKPSLFRYRGQYIVGAVVRFAPDTSNQTSLSVRGYFQGESFHASAVSLNAISNAVLRFLTNRSLLNPSECPSLSAGQAHVPHITTYNHPLPRTNEERVLRLNTTEGVINSVLAGVPLVSSLLLALSYLAASFALALIHEYSTGAKHLQFVAGVKLAPYWLSNYLWDMLLFLIACGAMLAAFAFFNLDAFSVKSRLRLVAFLFLAYAWAVLPEMYLLARFFKSPTSGLVWLTVFNDFTAVLALLVVALLNHPLIRQQALSYSLSYWCISISPTFAVSDAIFVLFENYEFRKICDNPMIDILCYYNPTMPCCLKTCDPFCAYWTSNDISFDKGGIGFHLTAMVVQGLIFGFLVLFLDSVVALRLKLYVRSICARLLMKCFACENCYSLSGASATNPLDEAEKALVVEDDDVSHHRHLVESMPLNRLKAQTSLALRRVTKVYGSIGPAIGTHLKPSVDRVSLAVLPGDCFGLLGVNGAGKTTMFRMITGDLDPSDGQILVNGFQLNRNLRDAQCTMGYCPQFDALLSYLTGRETLQLYARLRGIREGLINVEVDRLLHQLQLTHYSTVRVAHYSGGKRRKLSVAVALVGGTPLVCLDEPTTGVDPVSRRKMWNVLLHARLQGRTLVLSSHSMEECEALCTRVSIMVNGRLKCLGTCQHLKARFGRGYSLTLQVARPQVQSHSIYSTVDVVEDLRRVQQQALEELVSRAQLFVTEHFPTSHLVDRHQDVIHYHLPTSLLRTVGLSDIFRLMEQNKDKLSLVNYSVSQTTLEQIFTDLAKMQEEPMSARDTPSHSLLLRLYAAGQCCRQCYATKCCSGTPDPSADTAPLLL